MTKKSWEIWSVRCGRTYCPLRSYSSSPLQVSSLASASLPPTSLRLWVGSKETAVMTPKEQSPVLISSADQKLALSSLEHDQLVHAKKHFIPRRHLKGPELLVLWSLRIYLLFMMAVVVYQVWIAAH